MKYKLIIIFVVLTIMLANADKFIVNKIYYTNIIIILNIIIIASLLLFIYKQNISKVNTKEEKELIQNILNITPNITVVTDFRKIEYANLSFFEFFNEISIDTFNRSNSNLLKLFLPWDDYIYPRDLNNPNEFIQMIINEDEVGRKVMIFDKSYKLTAFSISISKVNYRKKDEYLLTLTNITENELVKKDIEIKAYYDGLTNVFNRHKFNELFDIELRQARRYHIPFCIAIIDIDLFKNFNDTYGHLVGDEVLIALAKEINENVRDTDVFARWGGEEFTILFCDTTLDIAIKVCNKLRSRVERIQLKTAGNITASFGVTSYKNNDNLEIMFQRCDKALYLAKDNGRNKVEAI